MYKKGGKIAYTSLFSEKSNGLITQIEEQRTVCNVKGQGERDMYINYCQTYLPTMKGQTKLQDFKEQISMTWFIEFTGTTYLLCFGQLLHHHLVG